MNKKWTTLFIVFCTGLMFITVGALTAAEKVEPPDEVTIENEGYKTDKKGPVKLSHKKHNEEYKVACTDCHHDYQIAQKPSAHYWPQLTWPFCCRMDYRAPRWRLSCDSLINCRRQELAPA